ncbi:hypothetical protein UAJ10_05310 [Nitrospirillum sp. BR 11164]|uniref:hypothetical protein n=1 Tax=Nitrospirillum sp. BR 11164 TaxID=3104324 RepID=UPI002AFFF583|nr:hypothetical protein [Nitrospirillum sp. BR 11164]MEA1648429.1 hypothetical protein [Nitrospirillum sp. BR 11164]
MLDIATSMVFVEVLTAVNCIAAFVLWRAYRDLHGLIAISTGCLALTAGFALMLFRGPHVVTASNAALVLAIGLVTDGMVVLAGGTSRRGLVLGLTAFTAALWELMLWMAPGDVPSRVVAATLIYIGFYARLLVEVIRNRSQVNSARICLIVTLVLHITVLVARMVAAQLEPDPSFVFSPACCRGSIWKARW